MKKDFIYEKYFNECRQEEIRKAKQSLTKEQVDVIADERFDHLQMEQIRWGYENGLTVEQVESYADPRYNWLQMEKIRLKLY